MKISKYNLELIVFICGAVVMIFELAGSRVLGPYFGTSIFVWTGLIGIILGSLSLGYYLGGKIADRRPAMAKLSLIIFLSAVFIGLTYIIKDHLLAFLQDDVTDLRTASVLASLLLFSPASILLGIVSPYAAKLKLHSLDVSGATVGNLYAISTSGSIIGTFLAGFYLIPSFGTNNIMIMLAVALALTSLLGGFRDSIGSKIFLAVLVALGSTLIGEPAHIAAMKGLIDVDTAYNRIWIYEKAEHGTRRMTRMMGINNENHSSMFLGSDELVNNYTKYYHLARHFSPGFQETLMLGGAGYSFPKELLRVYPEATIDVVEIDPKVTELAKKYFRLQDDPRLYIYHEDGRVYLNKTQKKYDVIFGDAFGSRYSIPYQLTTREAVQREYDMLNDDGVVILNLISAVEGEKGKFLRAEYRTYKEIFPQVHLFLTSDSSNGSTTQNIVLIALKSKDKSSLSSEDPELSDYLKHIWNKKIDIDLPILTDDFAPVDFYLDDAI